MERNARRLLGPAALFDAARELERCARLGIEIHLKGEPGYPARLAEHPRAPALIYARGRLEPGLGAIAVIGARRASAYGERAARLLSRELSRAGLAICSGLARGIDAQAHSAALEARGPTWAVIGSGLARVYPPEHEGLARRIAESGGALISEFPLDAPPLARNFPMRNRVVAGLSLAALVVEGRAGSGALITAQECLDLGRPLFAVPGPFDSALSAAPHGLLRAGALMAERAEDVLQALPELYRCSLYSFPEPALPALSSDQAKILQCLGSEGLTLEEASAATGLDFPRLSSIIFELELRRLILRLPGQRYAQKGRLQEKDRSRPDRRRSSRGDAGGGAQGPEGGQGESAVQGGEGS